MTENMFERSLAFAIKVHEGQKRKGKDIPYIEHIYSVGEILRMVTDDIEIWSAGALHDTVEDCQPYGSVTLAVISELASERVARMVGDVTEADKSQSWELRKQQALEHIQHMEEDSLLVKTADLIANLSEMVADLSTTPAVEFFGRFNAGKEKLIPSYVKRYEALLARWPDNPLLPKLEPLIAEFIKLAS